MVSKSTKSVPSFSKMIGSSLSQSFLSWFQENRGLSGHFASLVVSRKSASQRRFAAYRGTLLRSCFQKKGFRTPLFLFSPFSLSHFLFSFFSFFFLFLFLFLFLILFQKKVPATYGDFDFFFFKIPPILKLEVGFLST